MNFMNFLTEKNAVQNDKVYYPAEATQYCYALVSQSAVDSRNGKHFEV